MKARLQVSRDRSEWINVYEFDDFDAVRFIRIESDVPPPIMKTWTPLDAEPSAPEKT